MMARRPNAFVYDEVERLSLSPPDIAPFLTEHYAQCGEDVIVAGLLEAKAFFTGKDMKTMRYCEIGGNHPVSTSATYLLQRRYGCTGLIVEANPYLIEDLRKARPEDTVINKAVVPDVNIAEAILNIATASELSSLEESFVANWPGEGGGVKAKVTVPAVRIDELCESYFSEESPLEFLSIDVEGLDFELISSVDLDRHRPFVVQLEPSDHFRPGNSREIAALMTRRGYWLVAKTEVNLIFVDRRLATL